MITYYRRAWLFIFFSSAGIYSVFAVHKSLGGSPETSTQATIRLLMVIDQFPSYSKRIALEQIKGLITHGYDVSIYLPDQKRPETIELEEDLKYLLDKTYFGQLPPDIGNYAIIFCQDGMLGKRMMPLKQEHAPKSLLVTCFRGDDISLYSVATRAYYQELFEHGTLFLPNCKHFQQRLIALGANPEKIHVLYSGINCTAFSYRAPSIQEGDLIQLISVTRFAAKESIEDAIQAVAELTGRDIRLNYTIIGDGPQRHTAEELIKKLNIQNIVHIIGQRTQQEIIALLKTAHIALVPSGTASSGAQEGIPAALREAVAIGLPVISTEHSGIPELIEDGVSGLLAPEHNSTLLAEKIEYMIKHQEQWCTFAQNARKKLEQYFDITVLNDRLDQLLRNLL